MGQTRKLFYCTHVLKQCICIFRLGVLCPTPVWMSSPNMWMSSEEPHLGLLDSIVCSAEILCEDELFC